MVICDLCGETVEPLGAILLNKLNLEGVTDGCPECVGKLRAEGMERMTDKAAEMRRTRTRKGPSLKPEPPLGSRWAYACREKPNGWQGIGISPEGCESPTGPLHRSAAKCEAFLETIRGK